MLFSDNVQTTVRTFVIVIAITVLTSLPATIQADDQMDLEAVAGIFIRILTSTESEFHCLFRIESVTYVPATSESASKYYAEYRAAGSECGQASVTLDSRGKKEGIVFYWLDTYYVPTDAGREPILDLLHQIDPPVE